MESHVVVFECIKNTIILFFRLLRQGVIEAKTRGSRKQRKEKKNRTKKVLFLVLTHLTFFSLNLLQVRGIAKAKVGQAGKKVIILVMLTLLLFCELGLTISIAVRCLALLESSYLACSTYTGIVLLSINGRTIIS